MRPIDDLTMYAYGLLEPEEELPLGAHLKSCATCAETVELLRRERGVIERAALSEEPGPAPAALLRHLGHRPPGLLPRRQASLSWAAIAVAAVLLAALAWLLFRAPPPENTPLPVAAQPPDDLGRLIAELRSASPLHREIAVLALRAYGEAALDKIAKAEVDPALFAGYRLKPEDAAVRRRISEARVDLSCENEKMSDVLKKMADGSGVTIRIDPSFEKRVELEKTCTFKVKDLLLKNSLALLVAQIGAKYRCEDGAVILLDSGALNPGPARAPVRIGRNKAAATRFLKELRDDAVDRRAEAKSGLYRLGFAAEDALWEALDSKDVEVQSSAADVLRWLYSPDQSGQPLSRSASAGIRKAAYGKSISLDVQSAPVTAVLDWVRETSGLDCRMSEVREQDAQKLTFVGNDLPVHSTLTLSLGPLGLEARYREGFVVVSPQAPARVGNFWTKPEEARRLEGLLASLSAPTRAERDRAAGELRARGEGVLPLLRRASEILEGDAAELCESLYAGIFEAVDPNGFDEPLPEPLRAIRPADRSLLEETANLDAQRATLESLLKNYGVRCEIRAKAEGRFSFKSNQVRLGTLLKALTYPQGLDFYVRERKIIVDTARKARQAVEK